MPFEYPQLISRERLDLLWADLWRTVEQLRLLEKRLQQAELGLSGIATVTGSPATTGRGSGVNGLHKLPFGTVTETVSGAKSASVDGITELEDGAAAYIINDGTASVSGWTLNVNGLGGKPVYNSTSGARITTTFAANAGYTFVYNSDRDDGNGGWDMYYGYDSNTNTIGYQLRTNSTTLPASDKFYRYRLLFTSADGTHWVPANTSTSTNATASRAVNQTKINPFGRIVYYGTTAAVNAGANPGAAYLWAQYVVTLGYSFNRTGAALALTNPAPVYIKCTPQADGSAIIDDTTPYVQALPSTADGKIYIYLGNAVSATTVEIVPEHPVYQFRNGTVQLWTGA